MNGLRPTGIAAILLAGIALFATKAINTPDTAKVAGGAPMVDVRVPAVLSAEAQIGKAGFDARCATCHGENAAGQDGVAPPLIHKIYEPNHHGDVAFQLAAKTGVRAHHWKFGNMPPVEGVTDAEVAQITLYVRELQRENGIH